MGTATTRNIYSLPDSKSRLQLLLQYTFAMNPFEQLHKWIPLSDKLIKTAKDNSEIVAVVAGAVTLAGAVHIYYKSSKPQLQGNSIDGIPGPKHLPILGNLLEFTVDSLGAYMENVAWLVPRQGS